MGRETAKASGIRRGSDVGRRTEMPPVAGPPDRRTAAVWAGSCSFLRGSRDTGGRCASSPPRRHARRWVHRGGGAGAAEHHPQPEGSAVSPSRTEGRRPNERGVLSSVDRPPQAVNSNDLQGGVVGVVGIRSGTDTLFTRAVPPPPTQGFDQDCRYVTPRLRQSRLPRVGAMRRLSSRAIGLMSLFS